MEDDDFGVPSTLLGPHQEDFYRAVGRIICLSALLENNLLSMLQALTGSRQDEHTTFQLAALITACTKQVKAKPTCHEQGQLLVYLDRIKQAVAGRNEYAHNVWPAQADGSLFGWRVKRRPDADGSTHTISLQLDDVRAEIDALVAVLVDWQQYYWMVSGNGPLSGQRQRTPGEAR